MHCESPAFVQVMGDEMQKAIALQGLAQLAPWKPASQVHVQSGRVPVALPWLLQSSVRVQASAWQVPATRA